MNIRNIDSYFLESGHQLQFEHIVTENFNCRQRAALDKIGLILLKPDAIVSGKGPSIVSFIRRQDISVVDAIPICSPKEFQFEELYKFNLTLRNSHNQIGSWWLNRKVYTMGPSLLLLVRDDGGTGTTIFGKIQSFKGSSDPHKAKPGQIRHEFKGTNMALNLVHTSDNLFSLVREYLIFSSLERLKLVTDRLVDAHPSDEIPEVEHAINLFFDVFGSEKVQTNVFRVCVRLINEVMLRNNQRSPVDFREMMALSKGKFRDSEMSRFECNVSLLRDFGAAMRSLLPSESDMESTRELVDDLSSLDRWSDLRADKMFLNLAAHGLSLSTWDKLVIQSTAHYIGLSKLAV